MARSQKVIPIKLNQRQIDVVDALVKHGEFNGRSHAIREMVLPALNATVTAMESGSSLKAMHTWIKEMEKLTKRMDAVARNSQKGKQEDFEMDLNLPPIEVQPV